MPKLLERSVLRYVEMGFKPVQAHILGAIARFKDTFVYDSVPKRLFARDEDFCREALKIMPAKKRFYIKIWNAFDRHAFARLLATDHKRALEEVTLAVLNDIPYLARLAVHVDPRILGEAPSKIKHDPALRYAIDAELERFGEYMEPDLVTEREIEVRMLMAVGNGWSHPVGKNNKPDPEPLIRLNKKPSTGALDGNIMEQLFRD